MENLTRASQFTQLKHSGDSTESDFELVVEEVEEIEIFFTTAPDPENSPLKSLTIGEWQIGHILELEGKPYEFTLPPALKLDHTQHTKDEITNIQIAKCFGADERTLSWIEERVLHVKTVCFNQLNESSEGSAEIDVPETRRASKVSESDSLTQTISQVIQTESEREKSADLEKKDNVNPTPYTLSSCTKKRSKKKDIDSNHRSIEKSKVLLPKSNPTPYTLVNPTNGKFRARKNRSPHYQISPSTTLWSSRIPQRRERSRYFGLIDCFQQINRIECQSLWRIFGELNFK